MLDRYHWDATVRDLTAMYDELLPPRAEPRGRPVFLSTRPTRGLPSPPPRPTERRLRARQRGHQSGRAASAAALPRPGAPRAGGVRPAHPDRDRREPRRRHRGARAGAGLLKYATDPALRRRPRRPRLHDAARHGRPCRRALGRRRAAGRAACRGAAGRCGAAPLVRLAGAYAALKVVATVPYMAMRVEERAGWYVLGLVVEFAVLVGGVYYFLAVERMGLDGVLVGYVLSAAAAAVLLSAGLLVRSRWQFRRGLVAPALPLRRAAHVREPRERTAQHGRPVPARRVRRGRGRRGIRARAEVRRARQHALRAELQHGLRRARAEGARQPVRRWGRGRQPPPADVPPLRRADGVGRARRVAARLRRDGVRLPEPGLPRRRPARPADRARVHGLRRVLSS